jgi:hypothetical protein
MDSISLMIKRLKELLLLWILKICMNHNVKELIEQEKLIQTMKCGHPLMEDMERINVTWVIKLLILDVSKTQSVSMEKS